MSTHANSYEEEEDDFIKVVEKEDSEFMEFPKEEDGTVLLRTIQTQFANAIGLKFKAPSGAWRAVREVEDCALVAPKGGWGNHVYSITFSETKKRKNADVGETNTKFVKISENPLLRALAVLGIPDGIGNHELKDYFEEKYGELSQFCVKFDRSQNGRCKGYGFITFINEDHARQALDGEDYINGQRVYVRLKTEKPMKMFVNGLPHGTTQEDLVQYFSQFGTITDSKLPLPFRGYAFFTYSSSGDAHSCLKKEHIFRDAPLNVKVREERGDAERGFGNRPGRGGFGNYPGRGGFGNYPEQGGFGNGTGRGRGRGGGGIRRGSPFRGGMQQQGYPGYSGGNIPPRYPPGQNNDAAELKHKLLHILKS